MDMDKEFLEWWDLHRLEFFQDDDMGIREIAAAAWKAGQRATSQPADGVGELVLAAAKFLDWMDNLKPEEPILGSANNHIDSIRQAFQKIRMGGGADPSDVGK
jgi:hypothetical protein